MFSFRHRCYRMNLYEELPRINLLITYTNFSQPFVNSSMSCVISSVGILNSGTHKSSTGTILNYWYSTIFYELNLSIENTPYSPQTVLISTPLHIFFSLKIQSVNQKKWVSTITNSLVSKACGGGKDSVKLR